MQTPIVDGLELGTNFVIYSSSEAILMEFVGGTFLFNFRKLFGDEGVINTNCVVEVDGRHYVFGQNEIYVTDGTSRTVHFRRACETVRLLRNEQEER